MTGQRGVGRGVKINICFVENFGILRKNNSTMTIAVPGTSLAVHIYMLLNIIEHI